MQHHEKIRAIKNVTSNWFGFGLNVLVGLLLSPYILHRLGDEAFGLWVLIFSITGYYGLFDFGVRSSIIRYVARYHARGETEELNQLVNTTLFCYSCVALFLLPVTVIGSWYVERLFSLPPGLISASRVLFLIVGASVALGFPIAVFNGILEGLQEIYWLSLTNVGALLVRALLIVLALQHGYGLITVGLITAGLPLVAGVLRALIAFRRINIVFAWRYVSKAAWQQVVNYGAVTFMITLAQKLRFKTDAVVIGTFLSAAAITQFAIGSRMVDYATDMVDGLAQIFTPMSSHYEAKGEIDRLRSIYIAGCRACALIIFPVCVALIILGKSVIEVWVGARYIEGSYPVLLVLIIPGTMRCALAPTGRILFGMAKHKKLAIVSLIEGVSNLVLSILLVRPFGVIGDAVGTAIPLAGTCIFFLSSHLCGILGIPVGSFLRRAFGLPFLLCLPLAATLLALRSWFVPHHFLQLAFQCAVGSVVYLALAYKTVFSSGEMNLRTLLRPPQAKAQFEQQPAATGQGV